MPVKLPFVEAEFVKRIDGYCARGLSEPEMAKAEETSLTSLRLRLLNCGFKVDRRTDRWVARTGSGETFADLKSRGEFVVHEEDAEGVAA